MVGMAKDISAGAVMFSTIISIIIGCLLFGQTIIEIIAKGTIL
jgi:diacylglycerol kinase